MSMCRSLSSGACLRSSSLSRWIGLRPITPGTGPSRVVTTHALADEHERVPAADLPEAQVAVVVDVRDVQADLVDVADDRDASGRRRCPRTRANEEPTRSPPTSAANALHPSRHTRAGSVSWPDGPAVSSVRGVGIGTSQGYCSEVRSRCRFRHGGRSIRSLRSPGRLPPAVPQHELEDAAVAEVALLLRRVDPDRDRELLVVGAP